MPHITTAMQRSVRRGVSDIVLDSLLGRRSITGEVSNVKNTFSSWDNCMKASYCKWPVIIGIVVISLILLSIITCIVRCACCGMSCCCSCFRFLSCCDCCGGCCDGKKDKPMKHLDDPYSNAGPKQGYQAPAPMMGGALGGRPEPPQYAQFEVGKNGLAVEPKALNEDALPPMPSWEGAQKKHIETEEGKNAVELGELDPATGQKMPLMSGAATPGQSMPPSPMEMGASPYGGRPGQGASGNGYMGVAASDPHAQSPGGFNSNGGYRGAPSPGPGRGMRGPGGFASPPPQEMGLVGPGRGYRSPPPQEMGGPGGYGSPQDPYGPNNGFAGGPPGPGYGRGQPNRQYSGDNNGRPYPPQPNRQYSGDSARPYNGNRQYSDRSGAQDNFQPPRGPSRGPGGPNRMASPPLNNNAGFDFGTGGQQPSTRSSPPPQQTSYGQSSNDGYHDYDGASTAPPTYASRSPPPEPAYPGYKPYQAAPSSNHQRAPTGLTPGGRSRREPQGWDPVAQ